MSVSKSTKNTWREKTKKKTNKPLIVVQVAHSRALILSQNCFYQVYHLSFPSTTPCSTTCIFWPLQWTHPLYSNTLPFPCRVLIKAEWVSWNGEKIGRRMRELLLCLLPSSLLLTNSWSPRCKCCHLASRVGSFPENPPVYLFLATRNPQHSYTKASTIKAPKATFNTGKQTSSNGILWNSGGSDGR